MGFVLSRHLYSPVGAHGHLSCVLVIPGERCSSSISARPGRQLEWLGGEFCLLVVLGLEARDCVGCLSGTGFISVGACTVTYIT